MAKVVPAIPARIINIQKKVAEKIIAAALLSVKSQLSATANKIRERSAMRDSFTISPSWQKTKYTKTTARLDKRLTAGRPYFMSGTGDSVLNILAKQMPEIERRGVKPKGKNSVSIFMKIADPGEIEQYKVQSKGKTKAVPLATIFLTRNRAGGRIGKGPGGGPYQIAFYDDVIDTYIPQIKEIVRNKFIETTKTYAKATVASMILEVLGGPMDGGKQDIYDRGSRTSLSAKHE